MRKTILSFTSALLGLLLYTNPAEAQESHKGNPQTGDYGYLYCHMNDRGRAWTAFALSRDGLHYHDLLNGDSVFSDAKKARIEGATRDAYLCRKHDLKGYLMVCTDMNVGAKERLGKKETWDNYGIDLLTSDDLLHWQSKTFDFRLGKAIFSDPESESVYKDWSTINRVWAPQIQWDADHVWPDGHRGGYFIYYSMWNRAEEAYDRMYYSYADETFSTITQPRLLFDWGYATIDADINWVAADQQWHMMIKKEGGKPGLFTATAPSLQGPWSEPVEEDYVNFEGNKKCEGVSAFQLAGDSTWHIGYIEYSSNPKNYRICQADQYMRNFHSPRNIEGVNRPQHGSFLRITKEEFDRLQAWSDGYEMATLPANESNPVIEGYYADPEILYSERDGLYYLYPTTDGNENWMNHDFRCYSSADLKNWKAEGVIFDLEKDCPWTNVRAWAPCIIERKTGKGKRARYKYYFYYVADNNIGVAVADNPTGPFRNATQQPLVSGNHPALAHGGIPIDPDVMHDPVSGKYYLYWGNGTIVCSELGNDMTSIKRDYVLLPSQDKQRYHYNEGTYVFYHNGKYYFTWSENPTRSKNYRVRYLISDSPIAFVRDGKPAMTEKTIVLQKDEKKQIFGTGHHAVVQNPTTGDWYIIYHRMARPESVKRDWHAGYYREICIDPLKFDADGKIIPVEPSL